MRSHLLPYLKPFIDEHAVILVRTWDIAVGLFCETLSWFFGTTISIPSARRTTQWLLLTVFFGAAIVWLTADEMRSRQRRL